MLLHRALATHALKVPWYSSTMKTRYISTMKNPCPQLLMAAKNLSLLNYILEPRERGLLGPICLVHIEPSTYQHGYAVIVSLIMILYWKKMSSKSPSATGEAWHWPKTGYSTLGMKVTSWASCTVLCPVLTIKIDTDLSLSRACGSTVPAVQQANLAVDQEPLSTT